MAKHEKPRETTLTLPAKSGVVVTAILLVVLLVFWGFLISSQLVPPLYLGLGILASLGLTGCVLLLTWKLSHRVRRVVGFVLAGILLVGCVLGGLALWRFVHTVRQVTDTSVERSVLAFYVEEDSSVTTLNELDGKTLGILTELDRPNTDETLQKVGKNHNLSFSLEEYEGLAQLADGLRKGQVEGILLNQAFLPLYEELSGYEDFSQELREISVQEVEHVMEHTSAGVPESEETEQESSQEPLENPVVTVLISGSDTRGNVIDQRGRSDVNIIARINRETHKILLVSTPRDFYVPLAFSWGNPEDKLTHAGIYGMDVLMGTLENLYDTQIDYYFRINFTGFTEIIDALGGIEVTSNYDFTAGGNEYHVGTNYLNGEEALAFARERYSFSDGDRQRGRNQMAVIEGVVQKAMSPSILTGYLGILESVQDCVDTSVPYDLIAEMVRLQLSENAQWEIESYSVNGSDASGYTYSMTQKLYVMMPDQATVQTAKEKLAGISSSEA